MEHKMSKNKAVYPGSFDPLTNGHMDIIRRAAKLYEEVTVAVLVNTTKSGLFSLEERVELIENEIKDLPNVKVDSFVGLLVDYCGSNAIDVIIRGLRAISDYEYEMQIAQMNRTLDPKIETVFLMTNTKYSFLSSSIVKEVARFGGDINDIVPPLVQEKLRSKYKNRG
ncbi:MAG: pantetheine-phosphate adenylyltransferase [Peptostreptococcaceae bacterium]|nr:pantetheine-phosphate adenylyltransferase [Peptostreptococcaceae bacterium]